MELPSFPYLLEDSSDNHLNADASSSTSSRSPTPSVPLGTSSAINQISRLQYRVLKYNCEPRGPVGDEMDMRIRRDLFF
jgi:hypothetical protein